MITSKAMYFTVQARPRQIMETRHLYGSQLPLWTMSVAIDIHNTDLQPGIITLQSVLEWAKLLRITQVDLIGTALYARVHCFVLFHLLLRLA